MSLLGRKLCQQRLPQFLSLISIASNELESDSISGCNLTQTYKNRLDSGAYETYYKGFTFFFNNTVLRGAGLNGCAIFVRKLWIWLFEDDVFSTFWGLHTST